MLFEDIVVTFSKFYFLKLRKTLLYLIQTINFKILDFNSMAHYCNKIETKISNKNFKQKNHFCRAYLVLRKKISTKIETKKLNKKTIFVRLILFYVVKQRTKLETKIKTKIIFLSDFCRSFVNSFV